MKINSQTGWFDQLELVRCVSVISNAIKNNEQRWLKNGFCKRLQVVIDHTTGDFYILDQRNQRVPAELVYDMFPELREDVVDGAAPLTQTTPVEDTVTTDNSTTD